MTAPADQVSRIFHAAVARPPEERLAFVAVASGGDASLRKEVESLLALDGAVPGFLERPAAEAITNESRLVDLVGQTWGAYTIVAPLGIGGMGEVYRAHDAKLDRDVALKVLRAEVSADPERRARLAREARSLAALSHPNIGAIYGLEEREGAVALVLELVEGPTLAERLADGGLPSTVSLAIARQVAEALRAAHDKGFVHRDLKPANIVLQPSPDGAPHAKVLDFGLAKPLGDAASRASMTDTTEGTILGTPAYMSPEQARGLPVDRRTDIWAFGCVLFEMLSGVPPFEGATVTDMLASILGDDPDWSLLPRSTPESVRRLLEHCLRKEPHRRLQDIGDAVIELEDGARWSRTGRLRTALGSWSGAALWLAGAAGLVAGGSLLSRARPAAVGSVAFVVPPSEGSEYYGTAPGFAMSPDGRHLAWTAGSNGVPRLWVRAIDNLDARPLPATEGALLPFWRPDSKAIGYFTESGELKTVFLAGGSPVLLTDEAYGWGLGADWNDRDDIVFKRGPSLWHVKAVKPSPPPRQVTNTAGDEIGHQAPWFLPDGDHFFYLVVRETTNEVRVGALSSAETRSLGEFESHVTYVNGYLFFVRSGNLTAQAFNTVSLQLEGEPWLLDVQAGINPPWQRGMFSVASTALAYRTIARPPNVLTWVNREGKVLGTLGESAPLYNVNLSVDGSRVAVSRLTSVFGKPAGTDIWTLDEAGRSARVTDPGGWEWDPAWSPDGKQIAFTSDRGHRFTHHLYLMPSNGNLEPVLLDGDGNISGPAWSPDGRYIIYNKDAEGGGDLWTIDIGGNRKPTPLLATTKYADYTATFSPDGKWIAYQSSATGQWEIYLRRFPLHGDPIRVSTATGTNPRWRGDGKELFFQADGTITAVDIDLLHGRVGQPHPLFRSAVSGNCCDHYAVSPDGQRFLLTREVGAAPPLTVVLNWHARLHH